MFFLNEEGKLISLKEWVERAAVREGLKPILYLTFCIYLVREILFLSGKSQGKNKEF